MYININIFYLTYIIILNASEYETVRKRFSLNSKINCSAQIKRNAMFNVGFEKSSHSNYKLFE